MRAGLGPDVTPNTLRHTFASWAIQRGVPLFHVAKALGHASTAMVEKHYGHLAPDHLDKVSQAISDEFSANSGPRTGQCHKS
jgi:integrase